MWFLSAIPVLGKVADAVASYFNKKQEVDLEKYKVKGTVDIKAIDADIAIIQARAKLAEVLKDDPGTKVARLWVLVPASVYFGVTFYYLTFKNLLPPVLVWQPIPLPTSLDYLVYAIIGYLFITAWRGR